MGHAGMHSPHLRHMSETCMASVPIVMASTGHTSTQAEHTPGSPAAMRRQLREDVLGRSL